MTTAQKVFPEKHPHTGSRHIDDEIIDIGDPHTKNALQKLDRQNGPENREKAFSEGSEARKQNGQKKSHRQKQNEIPPEIEEHKAKARKIPPFQKKHGIPQDRLKRTEIGANKKIFKNRERRIRFSAQKQNLRKNNGIQKKQAKHHFFHILHHAPLFPVAYTPCLCADREAYTPGSADALKY